MKAARLLRGLLLATLAAGSVAALYLLPRLARRLRRPPAGAMIDIAALERRLAGGEAVTIVDVRGRDEYHGDLGHIPASLNIPLSELPNRLAELQALKDRPLVLVCRTEKRSAKAAELLSGAGFRRVEVLRGGMEQWRPRRASLESDRCADPLTPAKP